MYGLGNTAFSPPTPATTARPCYTCGEGSVLNEAARSAARRSERPRVFCDGVPLCTSVGADSAGCLERYRRR